MTAWKLPIGRPNCLRVLACSTLSSSSRAAEADQLGRGGERRAIASRVERLARARARRAMRSRRDASPAGELETPRAVDRGLRGQSTAAERASSA